MYLIQHYTLDISIEKIKHLPGILANTTVIKKYYIERNTLRGIYKKIENEKHVTSRHTNNMYLRAAAFGAPVVAVAVAGAAAAAAAVASPVVAAVAVVAFAPPIKDETLMPPMPSMPAIIPAMPGVARPCSMAARASCLAGTAGSKENCTLLRRFDLTLKPTLSIPGTSSCGDLSLSS